MIFTELYLVQKLVIIRDVYCIFLGFKCPVAGLLQYLRSTKLYRIWDYKRDVTSEDDHCSKILVPQTHSLCFSRILAKVLQFDLIGIARAMKAWMRKLIKNINVCRYSCKVVIKISRCK
jgi:hypothetical protein